MASKLQDPNKSLVTGYDKAKQSKAPKGARVRLSPGGNATPGQPALEPDKTHSTYAEYVEVWKKCRDCIKGQRAIREGGETYVPALSLQNPKNYQAYIERGLWYGASARTIESFIGFVFRKPITLANVPAKAEKWSDDITLSKESLEDFSSRLMEEMLGPGRGGVLVDMPEKSENIVTVADEEKNNFRPYFALYEAEQIINWKYRRVNGVRQLSKIWLSETYEEDDETGKQVRLLWLDGTGEALTYKQTLYRQPEGKTSWVEFKTITPTKNRLPLSTIPFFPFSSKGTKIDIEEPPLDSLFDVNISHFQNSCDREHGVHLSGLPTLVVLGYQAERDENGVVTNPIYVGSDTALTISDPNADVKYVGVEGKFEALKDSMDDKKDMMGALGAQFLVAQKKSSEAYETHELKKGGESSSLAKMAGIGSRVLKSAYEFALDWYGAPAEIMLELNKDYFPPKFGAEDLKAWMAARQAGEISKETFFDILKFSEWLPDDLDYETEQERKEDDGPPLSMIGRDPVTGAALPPGAKPTTEDEPPEPEE